jgi:hypothetical protein
MRFHGVSFGSQHEIWSKQYNGKVRILSLQRHFKSIRFENKDLWAWKRPLSIVAYDRKIVI